MAAIMTFDGEALFWKDMDVAALLQTCAFCRMLAQRPPGPASSGPADPRADPGQGLPELCGMALQLVAEIYGTFQQLPSHWHAAVAHCGQLRANARGLQSWVLPEPPPRSLASPPGSPSNRNPFGTPPATGTLSLPAAAAAAVAPSIPSAPLPPLAHPVTPPALNPS